jgi:hypothetical protein
MHAFLMGCDPCMTRSSASWTVRVTSCSSARRGPPEEIRREIAEHGNPKTTRQSTCYRENKVEAGDWDADRGAERDLASKQTGAIQTVRRIIMFAGILETFPFRIDVRGLRVQTRQKLNERTNGRGRMLLFQACSQYSCARVPPPLQFCPLHCLLIYACGSGGGSSPCLGRSGSTRPETYRAASPVGPGGYRETPYS